MNDKEVENIKTCTQNRICYLKNNLYSIEKKRNRTTRIELQIEPDRPDPSKINLPSVIKRIHNHK